MRFECYDDDDGSHDWKRAAKMAFRGGRHWGGKWGPGGPFGPGGMTSGLSLPSWRKLTLGL